VLDPRRRAHAEIIICSLPNMVLKGANNLKILRQLRELNPHAQIIVHAERLRTCPRSMPPAPIT
jgi:DNA-binding NarL/FixJ family response regulator